MIFLHLSDALTALFATGALLYAVLALMGAFGFD
jgi:hypothetical protein